MERSRGVYSFLGLPSFYDGFQRLVGARSAHEWLLYKHWGLKGFRGLVVDVGCGPGTIFEMLTQSTYTGFDINSDYIASAHARFGDRATFFHGDVRLVRRDARLRDVDVVICLGVLHHLDDEETRGVVQFAQEILRPGGRFLGLEATYLIKQDRLSRLILKRDRGRNIRFQHEWDALLRQEFADVDSHVTTGLLRIPYTHYIYEATKGCSIDRSPAKAERDANNGEFGLDVQTSEQRAYESP